MALSETLPGYTSVQGHQCLDIRQTAGGLELVAEHLREIALSEALENETVGNLVDGEFKCLGVNTFHPCLLSVRWTSQGRARQVPRDRCFGWLACLS